MTETIYIKPEQNIQVEKTTVKVSDIAKVTGKNSELVRHINQVSVYHFLPGRTVEVISVLKVVELIQKAYPQVEVECLGAEDFVVRLAQQEKKSREILKTIFACFVIFTGAAFTIMAFHNDIDITKLFEKIYEQVLGQKDGFYFFEIAYSIGIGAGIIIFFNHFGRHKITPDPTPLQVQMRKYEMDVDEVYIAQSGRGGEELDVD